MNRLYENRKRVIRLVNNSFASIHAVKVRNGGTYIEYPQIVNLPDQAAAFRMNSLIQTAMKELVEQQHAEQGAAVFEQMIGTFEVKNNQRGILSLVLSNYAYAPMHAHGLTLAKSLTFSLAHGKLYKMKDLFKRNTNYESTLAHIVEQQAKARDIPLLSGNVTIAADQDFYLADKTLVVYFPAYEMTPGYVGLPAFIIPAYTVSAITDPSGPLAVLSEGL